MIALCGSGVCVLKLNIVSVCIYLYMSDERGVVDSERRAALMHFNTDQVSTHLTTFYTCTCLILVNNDVHVHWVCCVALPCLFV